MSVADLQGIKLLLENYLYCLYLRKCGPIGEDEDRWNAEIRSAEKRVEDIEAAIKRAEVLIARAS